MSQPNLELCNFEAGFKAHIIYMKPVLKRKHLRKMYEELKSISMAVKDHLKTMKVITNEDISFMSGESDIEVEFIPAADLLIIEDDQFLKLLENYDRVMIKYFPNLTLKNRRTYAKALCSALEVPAVMCNSWIP